MHVQTIAVDETFEYPTPPSVNSGVSSSKHPLMQHRRASFNINNTSNMMNTKGGANNDGGYVSGPSSISVFKANRKTRTDSVHSDSNNMDIVNGDATLPYDVEIHHAGQAMSPRGHPSSSSTAAASSTSESNAAPLLVKFGTTDSSPVCLQLNSNGTGYVRWTRQGIGRFSYVYICLFHYIHMNTRRPDLLPF